MSLRRKTNDLGTGPTEGGAQISIFDVQFIVNMKLFLETLEIEIGV